MNPDTCQLFSHIIYISNIYLTEKYVTKDSLRLIVGLDYIIGIYIGLMLDDAYASLINHW